MPLFSLLDISHAFGGPPVLDHTNFQVDAGERVCLVGRNGAGKSTLMKIIAGELAPDSGRVFRQPGAHLARLPQEVPAGLGGNVHDLVRAHLRPADPHEEEWAMEVRLDQLLEQMSLPAAADFNALSGGMQRRVLLARALASAPDLLLLDEPTNHLDLASILWLEEFLATQKLALFFVTHDRAFLQRLATRIVELDRGTLTNWDCDYATFLQRRDARLEAEEHQRAVADKKLAEEEAWIRRGVRAQRSRANARIEQLRRLRIERRERRERLGQASFRVAEAERSGTKVIVAENLTFAWPGSPPLVRDFNTTILRGDKIGLIGPNGAGKTTFLKLLLGQLAPTSGTVTHGTRLEIVYLDQLRAQLDGDKTVADNVADGNTHVTIDGRQRHVISYLQDFLFEPERARTPARVLSGGERNRLLLARLFTRPANVLVLDEPTNDLDAETLELLENLLVEYAGTLLLVSHDRRFLDEVVTSTFVFEGDGRIGDYVGGYTDWVEERERQSARAARAARDVSAAPPTAPVAAAEPTRDQPLPLSRAEQRELSALPARIEALETEQAAIAARLADPAFYAREPAAVPAARERLAAIEAEIAAVFARWEALEARQQA
jgi:ATP-binding cassette subfamily F protein uup